MLYIQYNVTLGKSRHMFLFIYVFITVFSLETDNNYKTRDN